MTYSKAWLKAKILGCHRVQFHFNFNCIAFLLTIENVTNQVTYPLLNELNSEILIITVYRHMY